MKSTVSGTACGQVPEDAEGSRHMDPNTLYDKLRIKKDLVTGFSILFSRFEYALKRTPPYALGDNRGVRADWCAFAKKHEDDFDSSKPDELQEAVEYLRSEPPNKQILRNKSLGWKAVEKQNISPLKQVVDAVRRVRNNLFHGGKFPVPSEKEPGRNRKLLQSCETILWELVLLNDEVRDKVHEP